MDKPEGTAPITVTYDAMIQEVPGAVEFVSRSERIIYWALYYAKGRMVTQDALYDALYFARGANDLPGIDIIKVFVSHLRHKIPGLKITNHRHLGYSMEVRHDA